MGFRAKLFVSFLVCAGLAGGMAHASEIMPSYASAPTWWSTDRYAPNTFGNVGTVHGKNNVLGIGISNADGLSSRPAAYQSTFYNTQGKGHAITGGAGDTLSAYLYVPASWADPTKGARRTDMWGVMTDGSSVTGYPIIGFTNDNMVDSFVGFEVWDDSVGAWNDLPSAVLYDAWNKLSITFTGSMYQFTVNGTTMTSVMADPSTTGFSQVLMQAYNFDDPNLTLKGGVANDYTANWANTGSSPVGVPEPGTLALFAASLLGMGLFAMRRKGSTSAIAA